MKTTLLNPAFSPAWIIQKKRDGKELTPEEIHRFIAGTQSGEVADYQATAFLMAVYFKGMTLDETAALTQAMLESGERYDLSRIPGAKVDKHSTGGVGDKISLILAPLAAACGLRVPMMSGRGLGHSGGTLDKLESIKGFQVHLPRAKFDDLLRTVGCAMIGQSEKIAPADKKLYALRDVTGTVECIPLIVASILSKKVAEGTEGLVFDVKVSSGAFMKTKDQARKLGKTLTQVAKKMGLSCRALVTDMNQPLGCAIGNSLEVRETIAILRNEKTSDTSYADVKELSIQLCAHMLHLGKVVKDLAEGRKLAVRKLQDGSAWTGFKNLVSAQGGSVEQIENPDRLPYGPQVVTWKAKRRGFLTSMDTEALGRLLIGLGGGRKKASDPVDPGVGLVLHRKLGAKVQLDEPLVTVYAPEKMALEDLEQQFHAAIGISAARKAVPKLIVECF